MFCIFSQADFAVLCLRQFPSVTCADVKDKITSQMNTWQTADNCKQGGEKCLYKV